MGGRALQRKRIAMLIWAVIAGLIVSGTVAAALYWMNVSGSTH
jgi:high-affinity Fe2+/Pb2+ permease